MCCLELVPLGLKKKKHSGQANRSGSWNLLGVLFKIFDKNPRLYYMRVAPREGKLLPKCNFHNR